MRTNTWLGLIAFGQVMQGLQAESISRQQRERDEARDAMFAEAAEAAQQGQFALWIQTPDGRRFEQWSHHALEASRAMDDRQAAWDLAWELDLRERRETARPVVLAEVEARVPNVPEEATRRAGIQGVVGCCVTGLMGASGVGLLWYGDVIAQSPRVIYMASSVGLLALLLGALAALRGSW